MPCGKCESGKLFIRFSAREDPHTNYVNLVDDEENEGDDSEETQIQAAIAASLQDSVQVHQ